MRKLPWTKYEDDGIQVPIEKWGRDHWSTFAYFETVTVDKKGMIDNSKMRCNPRLHRGTANLGNGFGIVDGSKYSTKIKDGEEVEAHDDWSCLEDMVGEGLVESWFRVRDPNSIVGHMESMVKLTDKGQVIAAVLRKHKADGGNFAGFVNPVTA